MTDPSGLTQPSTQTSPSTPPGTTPPGTAPAAEFRFGPESEPWMQGKTPAEVTAQARQLAELAAKALHMQQPQPQYQQPVYQQPPQQPPAIDPDEAVTGRTLMQQGQQVVQQAQQAAWHAANPALEMAAGSNLEMVKGHFQTEFARYGPEIYTKLATLPKDRWTIDNLKTVVNLVRADHLEELVSERASRLAAEQPALRSSGAQPPPGSPNPTAPDQALTDAQRATLRRHGLTPELVAEQAQKMGWTPAKWYEAYGKHAIGDAG